MPTVFASSICLLMHPRDHSRPACLRSEYRRTPHLSSSTYDENRLGRFDPRRQEELVASLVTNGNAAAWIKSSPSGTFARIAAFTTQSSA